MGVWSRRVDEEHRLVYVVEDRAEVLSHAGEIMTFRGRETALFFSVCKLLL